MKIAYLLGSMNQGGLENLVLDSIIQAKLQNLEVICIYRSGGAIFKQFKKTGVDMTPLRPLRIAYPIYFLRLRKY